MYGIKVTYDGDDLVTQCGSALLFRRAWAISAVAIGWMLVTSFVAIWAHRGQQAKDVASLA